MTADMLNNKKLNLVVTELFIRGRKLKICYYAILFCCAKKNIRLNSTHCFIMKNPNKWELQQIVFNHSSDIDLLTYF